jgi:FO synthase
MPAVPAVPAVQGGIHPDFTGDSYLRLLEAAKTAAPGIHVHAFRWAVPGVAWQGLRLLQLQAAELPVPGG